MENKNFSFYAHLTTQELYKELNTSPEGLTEKEAENRFILYGSNILKETTVTWIHILANQLYNPFIFVLFFIVCIYFFTNQIAESIVITLIIVINSTIGFYQEYQSNQTMKLLKQYLQTTIIAKRSNTQITVPTNKLVPGDIIILNAGDIIPADCCFIESENLIVDESSLTGES